MKIFKNPDAQPFMITGNWNANKESVLLQLSFLKDVPKSKNKKQSSLLKLMGIKVNKILP